MEVDEIQVRKFQRIGTNGRSSSSTTTTHDNKIVPPPPHKAEDHHHAAAQYHHHYNHHPDDVEDGLSVSLVKQRSNSGGGTGLDIIGAGARFGGWPSSRIVRVSRASGGKDRHSKVLTSKGLRDRRVRLSVTTAIQFYDLQDRLGYDQPSKAVEWLLKAASSSISELPTLNPSFPETPKSDENNKRSSEHSEHGFDESAPEHVELDGDPSNNYLQQQQQQQGFSNSKSACSSTSETSKGSGGLSLSRSESRIRARERARERAAEKEKEKDNESHHGTHQNVSPISQNNSSFTELLTAGISSNNNTSNNSPNGGGGGGGDDSNLGNKSRGQWSTSPIPMEYLSTGLFSSRGQTSSGFPGHIQLGNNSIPQFGDHHHQNPQHFSFVPENFVPVATSVASAGGSGECAYNLNFSISSTTSGLAGYNRGTLQSNSSQSSTLLHPHYIQRFSSIDGSNLPFFIGTSSAAAVAAPVENQHHPQFPSGFDARLQLCYGDSPSAARHSDHKGKGK